MYEFLSRLFGLALDLFFDRRHLAGEVPSDGPVLLVANHQNALVDPLVVARTAGRRVRFLAKEPLFRATGLGWLVKAMGCLPVYRASDGHDTSKNEDTFRAVHDALREGAAVCLFPEGISHDLPEVQRMKTGAARMAFGAEEDSGWTAGVRVVPVGLIWRDKTMFRSDLVTQVGDPLLVSDFRREDDREGVRELTDAIDSGIRGLTINIERWEDKPLIELAERIYPAEGETRVARLQRLADRAAELREKDPARLDALRDRAAAFQSLLQRLGLTAEQLETDYRPSAIAAFLVRNFIALLIGLPVALAGGLTYALPYLVIRIIAARTAPKVDVDEVAGIKIMVALLVMPLWHLGVTCALIWFLPWMIAVPIAIALPFAGLYTDHFLRRRRTAIRDLRAFFLVAFVPRARARLTQEREALRADIEAVAQFLDAEPTP